MPIQFPNIPQSQRDPFFFVDLDNSQANSAVANQKTLIIGQITSGGIAVPNVPILSLGPDDAKTQGGTGSQLARMVAAYRANDDEGEVWCLPLADDPDATAAGGSVSFTASPTAQGTLSLYIAGDLVTLPLTASEAAADMATALIAAINTDTDLRVTAAVDGMHNYQVNLTAKNKGAAGNDIDIRTNYLGTLGGEATPAGLGITVVAMTGGATNPSLTTAFTNCQDAPYDFIAFPFTDTASLNALKSFLNDQVGRWSYARQIYGHGFASQRGTGGALTTFGNTRNDQHVTVMGFNDSPTPNDQWAAEITGSSAVSLRADPGRPLHTLALATVLAPPTQSRFPRSLRNTLLYDGISTYTVADDDTVQIDLLITTYQTNPFGQPDNSYLKVETMFLLMYVIRQLQTMVTSKYGRMKLASDGTRFPPGSNTVTPSIIRGDLIAKYNELVDAGYCQNKAAFAQLIQVEKNANNPNRVDILFPGTLINQLDIFALLFQFRLS